MKQFRIYTAVVFSMIFWSVSFIWTRMAIVSFAPVTLISLRLLLASLFLLVVSVATKRFQKIRKEDFKWFVLLAFFEPYMYYIGETYGLTLVDSTPASVIVSTIPLFAPILAFFFLKEKMTLANILGIVISLVGVFFVIYDPDSGFTANPKGVALLFLAVFSAVLYTTVLRKISTDYHTINVIFYQSLLGLMFFIPTFFVTDFSSVGEKEITLKSVEAVLMLVVFASVIAFVLFAGVVREIGVAKTNVFVNLIPVFTALFAWWILGEQLTGIKITGIVIVVAGLFVSQINRKRFSFKRIRGVEY
ncbi:MAG: DMT family transporter [Paludibacter sp.]|nr:DMT family transporter [Paludibacter sp.]